MLATDYSLEASLCRQWMLQSCSSFCDCLPCAPQILPHWCIVTRCSSVKQLSPRTIKVAKSLSTFFMTKAALVNSSAARLGSFWASAAKAAAFLWFHLQTLCKNVKVCILGGHSNHYRIHIMTGIKIQDVGKLMNKLSLRLLHAYLGSLTLVHMGQNRM